MRRARRRGCSRARAASARRAAGANVAQTIFIPHSATRLADPARELSQRGISREDFCQDTSKAAELVGLASQPAIDVLCRKRAPMKRSGSVANGNMPVGLAAYWNYEPKQSEKIGDAL